MAFFVNPDFRFFMTAIKNNTDLDKIMYINIFVQDDDLKRIYLSAAETHNKKLAEDPYFYDAGFDLFLPDNFTLNDCNNDNSAVSTSCNNSTKHANKIDFQIKCAAKMYYENETKSYFTPFYTYARSSISKTPLRLANNQGIIDAGYRGNLIGMFDFMYNYTTNFNVSIPKYTRLLQICSPNLVPIYVNIVDNIEQLGPSTSRGEGGIGSTGK